MLAGHHIGQRKVERAFKNGIQAARHVLVLYLFLANIFSLPCKSKNQTHRKTVPSKMSSVAFCFFFLPDSSIHLRHKQT